MTDKRKHCIYRFTYAERSSVDCDMRAAFVLMLWACFAFLGVNQKNRETDIEKILIDIVKSHKTY